MLTIEDVSLESFQLKVEEINAEVHLRLSGTGDMMAVEPLKTALETTRRELSNGEYKGLVVDIRGLHLLNSSCIKNFVHFIYVLQSEGPEIAVRFLVDSKVSWQARALAALKRLAPEIVTIENASD